MEDKVLAGMSDTDRIKAHMLGRMRQVSAWVRQAMGPQPDGPGHHDAGAPPTAAKEKRGGLER
jgi:hypothetical protein